MTSAKTYSARGSNRLLAALPPGEATWLMGLLEPIKLSFKQLLYEPNQPIAHVYFPLTSVTSLLVEMQDGGVVEIGTVGNEGMVGLPVFVGATSTPGRALIQIPGTALRMPAATLTEVVLRGDGALYHVLQRYIQALFVQTAQGAACNRLHTQEQRFCRWMLMMHDRVGSDMFPVTHEFIAQMLGVRRATVSEVAAAMQSAGYIEYHRGSMTIRDRAGLEAASCECYGVIRTEYDRVLGDEARFEREERHIPSHLRPTSSPAPRKAQKGQKVWPSMVETKRFCLLRSPRSSRFVTHYARVPRPEQPTNAPAFGEPQHHRASWPRPSRHTDPVPPTSLLE